MVVVDSDLQSQIVEHKPRTIYKYSDANWDEMKNKATEFTNANQDQIDGLSMNESWNLFKNFINGLLNDFIPSKKSSTKAKVPWITTYVKRQNNRKKRFYKQAVQLKNPEMNKYNVI